MDRGFIDELKGYTLTQCEAKIANLLRQATEQDARAEALRRADERSGIVSRGQRDCRTLARTLRELAHVVDLQAQRLRWNACPATDVATRQQATGIDFQALRKELEYYHLR